MIVLTHDEATRVYDVLVLEGGAFEDERDSFVRYALDEAWPFDGKEWRFRGLLGFGGKLNLLKTYHAFPTRRCAWVSMYSEDHTDENEVIAKRIDAVVKKIIDGI